MKDISFKIEIHALANRSLWTNYLRGILKMERNE